MDCVRDVAAGVRDKLFVCVGFWNTKHDWSQAHIVALIWYVLGTCLVRAGTQSGFHFLRFALLMVFDHYGCCYHIYNSYSYGMTCVVVPIFFPIQANVKKQ